MIPTEPIFSSKEKPNKLATYMEWRWPDLDLQTLHYVDQIPPYWIEGARPFLFDQSPSGSLRVKQMNAQEVQHWSELLEVPGTFLVKQLNCGIFGMSCWDYLHLDKMENLKAMAA